MLTIASNPVKCRAYHIQPARCDRNNENSGKILIFSGKVEILPGFSNQEGSVLKMTISWGSDRGFGREPYL